MNILYACRGWRSPKVHLGRSGFGGGWLLVVATIGLILGLLTCPQTAWAQTDELFFNHDPHGMWRGPGGYFAWYKLVTLVVLFAAWIALADYANREAIRLEKHMKAPPELWSPIYLAGSLLGWIAVLAVPWFWAGLPIFVLLSFAPLLAFFVVRNQQVDREIRKKMSATGRIAAPLKLVDEKPLPIELQPRVADKKPSEVLFQAKLIPAFSDLVRLLDDLWRRRADTGVIVCTRDKAVVRMQVDGMWHGLGELDPQQGQALLAVARVLVGAAPEPSQRPVAGSLGLKRAKEKILVRFSASATKHDYRGQFRVEAEVESVLTLPELGMPSSVIEKVKQGLTGDGVFVVAATPGQGSTTLWKSVLWATDRWTRDWFAIVPQSDTDTHMENIKRLTHPDGDAAAAIELMRQMGLKQAGAFVIPKFFDPKLVDAALAHSRDEGRETLTQVQAKSAAEGLLRAYAAAGNRPEMLRLLRGVVYQRLTRKLCKACREKRTMAPEMIQKMGGNPRAQDFIYGPRTIPAELPKNYVPCAACHDLGYVGRTGVFEVIEMNDVIRKVMSSQPKIEAIAQAARKTGSLSMMQSGFPLLLDGTTSLEELKRVCGN